MTTIAILTTIVAIMTTIVAIMTTIVAIMTLLYAYDYYHYIAVMSQCFSFFCSLSNEINIQKCDEKLILTPQSV